MKLMHLSDLHLGKRLIETPMQEDQAYILDEIVRIAAAEGPRAVLIAGDVYDRSNPPAEAMTLFAGFLRRLTELGCAVLVISGNHDSPDRVAYLGELVRERGVYLSPVYDGHIERVPLEDEFGPVDFYLMPFIHPEAVCERFPEADIQDANGAARCVLEGIARNPERRSVILSHQFIAGSSFDPREQKIVGTLDGVDPALYDGFDYVALGHIHGAQPVGRADGTMRYCGTPLKYSKKEADSEKSVTLVELGPKGQVRVDTRPLRPLREVRALTGAFDALIEAGPAPGLEDDYYFITLTDEEDIPNAAARLRQRYKNLLALDFDNARTRAGASVAFNAPEADERTPIQLLMALYELTHHREMSDEARAFAERVIRETEGFEA